jgi:hypothetical protein
MKTLGLLPFRLGHGAALPLSEPQCDFYRSVAEGIVGERCQIHQAPPVATIAVDSETLNRAQNLRPESLLLEPIELLTPLPEIVVVDLDVFVGADLRGAAYLYLASAISGSLAQLEDRHAGMELMIVILTELQPGRSAFQKLLAGYLAERKLVVLTDDGEFLPADTNPPNFDRDKYRSTLPTVRGKPIDLLERKLVRQYGHFRRVRDGRHHECVRVFFDGNLCKGEIRSLVASYISSHYPDDSPPVLLHHSTMPDWLEGPVERLAGERKLECYDLRGIQQPGSPNPILKDRAVLLVVPLVDTGHIIMEVLDYLRKDKGVGEANIRVLSILSTGGNEKRHGSRVDCGGVPIDYLLRVSQERYPKSGAPGDECPMCRVGFPFSREGEDQCHMLTSYDFWEMALRVDLKDEDYVPSNRPSLGKVPDLPAILHNHGAWLAKKIGDLVKHHIEAELSDLLVVCPDQAGAERLTGYLAAVLGVNVVRVTDTDITRLRRGESIDSLKADCEQRRPAWFVALQSARVRDCIVMEEFSVSGTTRRVLEDLVGHLGKRVIAHFALVDYNPDNAAQSSIPCLSLYAWNWQGITAT